jgi:hypothetical protein
MGPVSIAPHVSVSPKASPTRTEVRSVFHQHRIGSDSTCPARGGSRGAAALGAGLAGAATDLAGAAAAGAAGVCAIAAGAAASHAPATTATTPWKVASLIMSSSGADARP